MMIHLAFIGNCHGAHCRAHGFPPLRSLSLPAWGEGTMSSRHLRIFRAPS